MIRRLVSLTAALILFALPLSAETATWVIDGAHSSAGFSVRHMMVSKVRGSFDKISGTVTGDLSSPTGVQVDVTIDASSINTGNGRRDDHLRSADFFEVEKYPAITFESKRIEKAGDGYRMTGELTIRGVTKEVVLNVDAPAAPLKVGKAWRTGTSAVTSVNRKDFGLTWNRALEAGGLTVGDEIEIVIDVELIRQDEPES
ncbi:MAG: YceI family protein [Thermoanaerobaculia bacterium]